MCVLLAFYNSQYTTLHFRTQESLFYVTIELYGVAVLLGDVRDQAQLEPCNTI